MTRDELLKALQAPLTLPVSPERHHGYTEADLRALIARVTPVRRALGQELHQWERLEDRCFEAIERLDYQRAVAAGSLPSRRPPDEP